VDYYQGVVTGFFGLIGRCLSTQCPIQLAQGAARLRNVLVLRCRRQTFGNGGSTLAEVAKASICGPAGRPLVRR
jgi:hypothetical protein